MVYEISNTININTAINPCTLHVATLPAAQKVCGGAFFFGTIQVERKLSNIAMSKFATVMWDITSVVSGMVFHCFATSRRTRQELPRV